MENDFIEKKQLSHIMKLKIYAIYDTLKTAERKSADFILHNPESFFDFTIVEAAQAADSSEATFVRLARKLGYSGYTSLKEAAAVAMDDSDTTMTGVEINDDDKPYDIVKKIFENSVQTLTDTLHVINQSAYEDALLAISKSRKIMLAGSGDAYVVAYSGYLRFLRLGLSACCHQDYDLQLVELSSMQEGDILLIVSHSGKTKTMLDLVKSAKVRKVTVISITNFPLSPLAKQSDIVLVTAAFDLIPSGEVISKRIPELCLMESLYTNLLIQQKDVARKHWVAVEDLLSANKT